WRRKAPLRSGEARIAWGRKAPRRESTRGSAEPARRGTEGRVLPVAVRARGKAVSSRGIGRPEAGEARSLPRGTLERLKLARLDVEVDLARIGLWRSGRVILREPRFVRLTGRRGRIGEHGQAIGIDVGNQRLGHMSGLLIALIRVLGHHVQH